jgi:hypothetical protein
VKYKKGHKKKINLTKSNESQKPSTFKTSRNLKLQCEPGPDQLNPNKMAVK